MITKPNEVLIGAFCGFVITCLLVLVFVLPEKFDELHDRLNNIEAGMHCPAPHPTPEEATVRSDDQQEPGVSAVSPPTEAQARAAGESGPDQAETPAPGSSIPQER